MTQMGACLLQYLTLVRFLANFALRRFSADPSASCVQHGAHGSNLAMDGTSDRLLIPVSPDGGVIRDSGGDKQLGIGGCGEGFGVAPLVRWNELESWRGAPTRCTCDSSGNVAHPTCTHPLPLGDTDFTSRYSRALKSCGAILVCAIGNQVTYRPSPFVQRADRKFVGSVIHTAGTRKCQCRRRVQHCGGHTGTVDPTVYQLVFLTTVFFGGENSRIFQRIQFADAVY